MKQELLFCSAKYLLSNQQKTILSSLALLILVASYDDYQNVVLILIFLAQICYLVSAGFKILLFIVANNRCTLEEKTTIDDSQLPTYSILLPLYQEELTLPALIQALQKIDYPSDQLQIKFILEEDDLVTKSFFQSLKLQANWQLIIVPYSLPRTKAKAINYALNYVNSKYMTVYDAEDLMPSMQLRQAALLFEHGNARLACLQARLSFFNRQENILTKLLSLEYGIWFEYMLRGLQTLQMPIPLAGTSNHFKVEILKKIGAMDAFNVTEDAELGMRLALNQYHTLLFDSETLEEAPITLGAWIKQRSRWIKGHLQTYISYMRKPVYCIKQMGFKGFISLQLFLGLPAVIFLLQPVALVIIIFGSKLFADKPIFIVLGLLNIVILILTPYVMANQFTKQRTWQGMSFATVLFPFYFILHTIASYKALWQLICCPSYWEKTEHGLTKITVTNQQK